MQRCVVNEKIRSLVPDLNGKCIAILGLAFKPETDDIREAPSLKIIDDLQEHGAAIRVFDPAASNVARRELKRVEFCSDEYDAALGADALVLVTEWNQFRNLDFNRLKNVMKSLNVVDLRNVYDPEAMRGLGFKYVAMGRG
jgi:UDPglucose 6-dehydrogenase